MAVTAPSRKTRGCTESGLSADFTLMRQLEHFGSSFRFFRSKKRRALPEKTMSPRRLSGLSILALSLSLALSVQAESVPDKAASSAGVAPPSGVSMVQLRDLIAQKVSEVQAKQEGPAVVRVSPSAPRVRKAPAGAAKSARSVHLGSPTEPADPAVRRHSTIPQVSTSATRTNLESGIAHQVSKLR